MRTSCLSVPVEATSRVEFRVYARRTPILSLHAGPLLVSLTLPERLRPEHVAFARSLAEQAAAYATEVERQFRNGNASRRAA